MEDNAIDLMIDYCENENNIGYQYKVQFAINNGFTEEEFKKTVEGFSITMNTIENHEGLWKYFGYLRDNNWTDDDIRNLKMMINDGLSEIIMLLFSKHPQLNVILKN